MDAYIDDDESEEYNNNNISTNGNHHHQSSYNGSRSNSGYNHNHRHLNAVGPYANSENDEMLDDMVMGDNMSPSNEANNNTSSSSNTELFNHYLKIAMQQQQQQNGPSGNGQQHQALSTALQDIFNNGHQVGANSSASNGGTEDFCEICQKQFCNKYYLKKHKQDVHGVGGGTGQDASVPGLNPGQTPKNIKRLLNELAGASSSTQKNNNSKGMHFSLSSLMKNLG
jgi:hypothetical protein